jgi:peptidase M23-like protein
VAKYANPIGKGLTVGRIDEGVDFAGSGNLYALSDGVITNVYAGWPGGVYILLKMDDGRYVYYAENIAPAVRVNQRVKAGDKIGYARGSFPYIEVGWSSPVPGNALARPHYTEGVPTPEGKDFAAYLKRFGIIVPGAAAVSTLGAPGGGTAGQAGGSTTPTGNAAADTVIALAAGAAIPAAMVAALFGLAILLAIGASAAAVALAARGARGPVTV